MHNYQVDQLLSQAQRLKRCGEVRDGSFSATLDETLAEQFLLGPYETAARSFGVNGSLKQLCADDRSVLLPTAVDNSTCLAATFIFPQSELCQCHAFIHCIETLYGQMSVNCHRWSSGFAVDDGALFQLGLGLSCLSANSRSCHPNLNGSFQYAE